VTAIWLDPTMKAELEQLLRSPCAPQGLVQRSRIVLAAAGKTNPQIASELQMPEVTVSKWRRCFASQGLLQRLCNGSLIACK
jgi:DNA-binding NarL/FixJ family response regulator